MRFPVRLVAVLSLIPVGASAQQGPSFDCDDADTQTEFAICGSELLTGLEVQMYGLYLDLSDRIGAGEARALADERLALRQACGSDRSCIARELVATMEAFQAAGAVAATPIPPGGPAPFPEAIAEQEGAPLDLSVATLGLDRVPARPVSVTEEVIAAEPEPTPEPTFVPEPALEAEPVPDLALAPEPQPEPVQDLMMEAESTPDVEPIPDLALLLEPEPVLAVPEPAPVVAPVPEAAAAVEPDPVPVLAPDPEPVAAAASTPAPAPATPSFTSAATTPLGEAWAALPDWRQVAIQGRLQEAGYHFGTADGEWTLGAEAAVRRFFADAIGDGLPVDSQTVEGATAALDFIDTDAFRAGYMDDAPVALAAEATPSDAPPSAPAAQPAPALEW